MTRISPPVLLLLFVSPAGAQLLSDLRIDGPDEVEESDSNLYTVVAEFDNGWEFDVTSSSHLWLDPGVHAEISPHGELESYVVRGDQVETIHAVFEYESLLYGAARDVGILDLDLQDLVVDRVLPGGNFFIVPFAQWPNQVSGAVRVFSRAGELVRVLPDEQVQGSQGTPSFDLNGNLVFGQLHQDVIRRVSPYGQSLDSVLGGSLNGPTGTAIDRTGGVTVGSYFTDSVKFFDREGNYLRDLHHSGTEDPHFVAYDRRGNLFVGSRNNGNGRVAVFDSNLNFMRFIGSGILVPHPSDLAFDKSQDLWVTMPGSIRKFTSEGAILDTITYPRLDPTGIALDEEENLWVTNAEAHDVYVFSPEGELLDRIDIDLGADPDPQRRLYGIAFEVMHPAPDHDADGDVDLDDYSAFALCLSSSGPETPSPFQECGDLFDLNWDGDIDLYDYRLFEQARQTGTR